VSPVLTIWGLAGAAAYWAAGVSVLYGADPLTPIQVALNVPLAVQELALAGYLIVKGFRE
jgi:3-polyprenyl-4-hydroxybenzoate decarboxylase